MSAVTMSRGNSIRILGLSKQLHRKLVRAVSLAGYRSLSEWLLEKSRDTVIEQQGIHGDLLTALTPIEQRLLKVIADGANDPEHIAAETMIGEKKLERLLADLCERGILEPRKQGGKTEAARGARRTLYFVSEKYQADPK